MIFRETLFSECEYNLVFLSVMSPLKYVISERNKEKLVDGGFLYVKDKVVGEVVHWRCELFQKKKCRARLHTRGDEIVRRWKTEHVSHTGDARAVEVAELKEALKRAANDSHLAPKVVVADCLTTASQHAIAALPPISILKRNIHNARRGKAKYPKLPMHRKDLTIPDDLLRTQKGENFLLHDSGYGHADRILIFGTENNLSLLRRAHLWLVDGTFKTAPRLFYQLYTVHCIFESETFPVLYALLPNKSSATYESMFKEIKAHLPPGASGTL